LLNEMYIPIDEKRVVQEFGIVKTCPQNSTNTSLIYYSLEPLVRHVHLDYRNMTVRSYFE
ncbi:hypothetical protein L9F63_012024, partial [Diploptera punctata]